jgi:hypothetical protein
MKRSLLSAFVGLGIVVSLVLGGCPSPLEPPVTAGTTGGTGSIAGYARYSGETNHSGITVSAERTDGIASLSVKHMLEGGPAGSLPASRAIAAIATTAADGSYTLDDLPEGTYTVYASSEDSLERAVTTSVTVAADREVTASDLNLSPTGRISGTATLNGAPTGNLGIAVFVAGTSYCAMTADNGAYTISDVPAGTGYVLVATKEGYDPATAGVDVSAGATTTPATLNLVTHVTPPTTGSISGTAHLNGAATGNAGVFVFLAGTSWITMTNDSGAYRLGGLAPGAYTLTASKEGYVAASASVDVTAGIDTGAATLNLVGVQVSAPIFTPGTGTHSGDVLVTLADATPGATIHYTTDGTTPTTASSEYDAPITVTGGGSNATITVKAIGDKTGMTTSAVSWATFTIVYPAMQARWAESVSAGSNSSQFDSVAVDSSGNMYAVGYIYGTGTYTFGTGVSAAGTYGSSNVVLVKYNSSGTAQWARTVSAGSSESRFSSVTVDSSGNVHSAGHIYGTGSYTFGTGVSAAGSSSGTNVALVKYDSSGTAQWTHTVSRGSGSQFSSVAVDSGGNVHAAGHIYGTGTYTFGTGVSAAGTYGSYNVVLVKYSE